MTHFLIGVVVGIAAASIGWIRYIAQEPQIPEDDDEC